ncbi:MAG: NADH:flavin oxidoreductase [Promethearchaeota archaeon CR_4]|nr:MAG: NADH:flavin oxidoreductase [Candidatus Lokiarchaeota archaeon CR_4]
MPRITELFKPIKINSITLPNRIVMPAMHLNMADNGYVTPQLTDFYVERAKGGVGMIVVGGIAVEKRGMGLAMMLSIFSDDYIPKLKNFTDAIHAVDGLVAAQLYHAGRYSFEQMTGEKPVSSSAEYNRFSKQIPVALTKEGIAEVVTAEGDAAKRAKDAGFDAVEILGSAGYIIDQFLSPVVNKRMDDYGESLENRVRFPQEVITSVRKAVGSDFPVWMRLSGDDFVKGSNRFRDKAAIAPLLVQKGLDAISITGGWHETKVPQITTEVPPGVFAFLSANIKKAVNVPVFVANRINDPLIAEDILRNGYADCIAIGRTLISDPFFPQKVKEGRLDDIVKCIGCNQGCFDNVFEIKPVCCIRNPRAGKEATLLVKPTEAKKKVLVVGGGPAGCEAAKVAAERGHIVLLLEKRDKLGGQVLLAASPPGREGFLEIPHYYERQLKKLGVEVRYNAPFHDDVVNAFKPDVAIIATGSIPKMPSIPGIDKPLVCTAPDALWDEVPLGRNVVILGGSGTGVEAAITIAQKGALGLDAAHFLAFYEGLDPGEAMTMTFRGPREVTILEMLPRLGVSIGRSTRWTFLKALEKLGIKSYTQVTIQEIADDYVRFQNADSKTEIIPNVTNVVVAAGVSADKEVYDHIKTKNLVQTVINIGDSKKPRTMEEAISEGFRAALKI